MPHFNLALFTQRFRAAAYGDTFREIADKTGVSAPTLSRLDGGSVPSTETLFALCAWMGVSPSAFLLPAQEQDPCQPLHDALQEIKAIVDRIN